MIGLMGLALGRHEAALFPPLGPWVAVIALGWAYIAFSPLSFRSQTIFSAIGGEFFLPFESPFKAFSSGGFCSLWLLLSALFWGVML